MKWRNTGRAMSAPQAPPAIMTPRPSTTSRVIRRLALTTIMSTLVFAVLWLWALNIMTSMLIASGFGVVLVIGSSASDVIEAVLDAIASAVLGVLAVIGAVIGGILSIFN